MLNFILVTETVNMTPKQMSVQVKDFDLKVKVLDLKVKVTDIHNLSEIFTRCTCSIDLDIVHCLNLKLLCSQS